MKPIVSRWLPAALSVVLILSTSACAPQKDLATIRHCNGKTRGDLVLGTFEATNASERTIRHISMVFATRDESGFYGGAEHEKYGVRIPPKRSAKLRFEFYVGRKWLADYRGVECVINWVTFDDGSTWTKPHPNPWL